MHLMCLHHPATIFCSSCKVKKSALKTPVIVLNLCGHQTKRFVMAHVLFVFYGYCASCVLVRRRSELVFALALFVIKNCSRSTQ